MGIIYLAVHLYYEIIPMACNLNDTELKRVYIIICVSDFKYII